MRELLRQQVKKGNNLLIRYYSNSCFNEIMILIVVESHASPGEWHYFAKTKNLHVKRQIHFSQDWSFNGRKEKSAAVGGDRLRMSFPGTHTQILLGY